MHKYIFLLSTLTITSLHSMNNHQRYPHVPLTPVPLIHNSEFSKDSTLSPNAKEKKCTCCQINEKRLEAEDNFKQCLKRNIHSIGLGSLEIPTQCKKEARECILEAGRARVADILADFKAAKDL